MRTDNSAVSLFDDMNFPGVMTPLEISRRQSVQVEDIGMFKLQLHEALYSANTEEVERALRHAVIWRKLSFGTQSEPGSRFVETLLTVVETCRQQDRDVVSFVTGAIESHWNRQPHPSLLAGV